VDLPDPVRGVAALVAGQNEPTASFAVNDANYPSVLFNDLGPRFRDPQDRAECG